MGKKKVIGRLEEIMITLESSKKFYPRDPIKTEKIIDQIIDCQNDYKKLTGKYYNLKKELNKKYEEGRSK